MRFDFHLAEKRKSIFWIGRDHPLNLVRTERIKATDAIGTVWSQNQLNALEPRVAGWLGFGLHHQITDQTGIILSYSPLFIPTLSPSLGFDESGDLNPKRYSRLPPSDVNTGGAILPIRYQLELGQIRDLVIQSQFLVGLANETENTAIDATWFSAPRPNAVPLTSAKLAVTQTAVTAKVEIEPQFPREQWTSFRLQLKKIPFRPSIEWVQGLHDWTQQYASLSGSNALLPFLTIEWGLLAHTGNRTEDPRFSDSLVFVRLPWKISDQFVFRNLIQSTLLTGKKSIYWLSELEFKVKPLWSILINARMLSGDDYSWFGDWRAEDSAGMGLRWSW